MKPQPKKHRAIKRLLIMGLCLSLLALVIRWQTPVLVHRFLAQQLAEQDIDLKCFDWHLRGFQQITIEQLCLTYQGIDANLLSARIKLMQAAFWENNFSWKNLVPAVDIAQIDILLPEKIALDSQSPGSAPQSHNKGTSDLTSVWLPDIRIQQLNIAPPDRDMDPLRFSLALEQQNIQRILQLTSAEKPEQMKLSLTQDQQKQRFELTWQLDLSRLYTHLEHLLPMFVEDTSLLNALKIHSGTATGKLEVDGNAYHQFQSQHLFEKLEIELYHETLVSPLTLHFEQQIDVDRNANTISIECHKNAKVSLSDISDIANYLLEKYQWQGMQASLPDHKIFDIALPQSLSLTLDEITGALARIEADDFTISSETQNVQLSDIGWTADSNVLTASIKTDNQIILSKKDHAGNNNTSNTLYTQLNGAFKGNSQGASIELRHYSVSGLEGNIDLISQLPETISWQDTLITGSGTLNWRQNGLSMVTEYRASLLNLQTGPVSLHELSSQGKIELVNQTLSSTQTVAFAPDIALTVGTSGTLDELKINAELPATQLNLINPIVQQLAPLIAISDGAVSASISSTLQSGKLNNADISLDVKQATASWQDYRITDVNTLIPLSLNSSMDIIAAPKQLRIGEVNAGAVITDLNSRFLIAGNLAEPRFQLQQLRGEAFHGSFTLEQLNYPLTLNSEALLHINQFNLNEVVNLFGDQGIEVSGTISGDIPLSFSEGLVSVEQAMIKADGEGKLRIEDNAAFQNLKDSQETLGLALSLIEDLHYTRLQSEVHLEPDGLMTLAVNIAGINQKEAQPINFNPTLTTNLYTGLKALRAGQKIAENIEQQLQP